MMLFFFILLTTTCVAQHDNGIDPEALIDRILAVDRNQAGQLHDVVLEAEYVEGEDDRKNGFCEKVRLVKKVYIMYCEDSVWFHEDYLEYYKDGQLRSEEDLRKEAQERLEKKRKHKILDISHPILRPFHPERRNLYEITYLGVAAERVEGFVCHQFQVRAIEESDTLLNGDYYFEAEAFHLVRVDFSPARLVKKMMFRLKELSMSILYGPADDDIWLPRQFSIRGKGKTAFFFGVDFAGTEYYRNPIINDGLEASIFEENNGGE